LGVRRREESGHRKRRGWTALLALSVLGAATPASATRPAAPAPSVARPALWVVGDHDTIIYLFGTFHAHDGKARWFSEAVKAAFDGSEQLVLETLVPQGRKAIAAAVKRQQASAAPARPDGLATARVAIAAARSSGLSVEQGADAVLHRAAAASGKPIEGLETVEQQLGMYQRLPGPSPRLQQAGSATPDPALAAFMRQMMAAWDRGDPSTFEAVIGAVRTQSPDAYRVMFQERNTHWAEWIARRLEEPGTVFMAVGTGHLVGRDSVQAKLASKGIRSARVN
jgi:uncharacterized protein YbaP (TraB family)